MPTYYFDSSAPSGGNGTLEAPYNSLLSAPVGAGFIYRLKRGSVFNSNLPNIIGGTEGNRTGFGPYYYPDGSDDSAKPRPVINLGDNIVPWGVNGRDHLTIEHLHITGERLFLGSDRPLFFLGNNCTVYGCTLTTNLTALYADNKTNVAIQANTITAATAESTSYSMMAIVASGSGPQTGLIIEGNQIYVGPGGNSGSHAIRVEGFSGGRIQQPKIRFNGLRPTTTGVLTTNPYKIGIFMSSIDGGEVGYNNSALFLSGFFASAVSNVWIHHNSFNDNGNFGIHMTVETFKCLIEFNTCLNNGRTPAMGGTMPFYGRALELSGGNGQGRCGRHVIRYNNFSNSRNYGGPEDNGTEGCGIGLDDACFSCSIYGNLIRNNEGNGIQLFGGFSGEFPPADLYNTGGHVIVNNYLINNATYSFRYRRGGGISTQTDGAVSVAFVGTLGHRTWFANNLIIGSRSGIRVNYACRNVFIVANVFQGQVDSAILYSDGHASAPSIAQNCYNPGIPMPLGTSTNDANGVPAPTLISYGVNGDRRVNPNLNGFQMYAPMTGSPLLDPSWRGGRKWRELPLRIMS